MPLIRSFNAVCILSSSYLTPLNFRSVRFFTSTSIISDKKRLLQRKQRKLQNVPNNNKRYKGKTERERQIDLDFSRLGTFLRSNQIDECLQYLNSHSYFRLPYRMSELLLKRLLNENRLEEAWYYIKQYALPNPSHSKTIIDHLFQSHQYHFIFPFAFLTSRLFEEPQLSILAYSKMRRFLKKRYDETSGDQDWWLLTDSIMKAFGSDSDMRYALFEPIRDFLSKKGIIDYDPFLASGNRYEKEIIFNMKTFYVWRTNNPVFNLNLNKEEWMETAKLFTPEIESIAVVQLRRHLDDDQFEKAMELWKDSSDKSYHNVAPFVKYFVRKQDLLGLLAFIDDIESSTSLKIRFSALSEFGFTFKETFPKYFDGSSWTISEVKEPLIVIFKYLYQETNVNSTLWNRDNLEMLRLALNFKLSVSVPRVSLGNLKEAIELLHSLQDL